MASCDDVQLYFLFALLLDEPWAALDVSIQKWRSATSWWPTCGLWSRNVDELDNVVPLLSNLPVITSLLGGD